MHVGRCAYGVPIVDSFKASRPASGDKAVDDVREDGDGSVLGHGAWWGLLGGSAVFF